MLGGYDVMVPLDDTTNKFTGRYFVTFKLVLIN